MIITTDVGETRGDRSLAGRRTRPGRAWRLGRALAFAAAGTLILGSAPASAAEEVRPTLVQTIATSQFGPPSPDPAGIVYVAAQDRLLISDSEVDEMPLYQGSNLFTATRTGSGIGTGTTLASSNSNKEPTGLGYNPADGTLFVSNDDADRIWLIRPGSDGYHGTADDTRTFFSTTPYGSTDPEGVEYDSATGHLFICDGSNLKVFDIDPVNGIFGDGNDTTTSFGIAGIPANDCEGIGIDPQRNTLLVVDPSRKRIYELSKTGAHLRTLLVDSTVIPTTSTLFASVTVAPTSNASDSPSAMNYWLADRHVDNGADPNENDGLVYELSLGSPPPPVDASPTITITEPANSGAVAGTTIVRANALDDVGVDHVTVAVDGTEIGSDGDGSDGWSVAWNTTAAPDGAHSVTATAVDTAGQTATDSNDVTVDNTTPTVSVTSPTAGSTVSGVTPVAASASDNDSVKSVRFLVDGAAIGTDANGADGWSIAWNTASVAAGEHGITAIATDRAGNNTTSEAVQVTVDSTQLVSIPIGSGADDVDEIIATGQVRRSTGDVELGSDKGPEPTAVGLRFIGVPVPQGATILHADVQFQADEKGRTATNLSIRAQASDSAAAFTTTPFNVSSRPTTSASVAWGVPQWMVPAAAGPDQRTPDLSAVIQEVVDRPGWSSGNSVAVLVTGSGRRTAESFEGGAPPILHLEYTTS